MLTTTMTESASATQQTSATASSKASAGSTFELGQSSNTAAASGSGSAAASTAAGTAAATSGGSDNSNSNSTSSHASKTTQVTAVDPRLPPGGIEMVTPAAIAPAVYYKIGDYVTFAWNYTSLSVTPSAIDVMASCSVNNQLYTISLNQSVQPTGAVTWDTGEYQSTATIPLLTETYTLVIYDANQDVSATPQAGYLAVQDQWTFGMYTPQPYTPLNGKWLPRTM